MTLSFALFIALLMLLGGSAVWRHETQRAEKHSREILSVAAERARAEIGEDPPVSRTLLQAVSANDNEIAVGGLSLLVAQKNRVIWRSVRHVPAWPSVGENWRRGWSWAEPCRHLNRWPIKRKTRPSRVCRFNSIRLRATPKCCI